MKIAVVGAGIFGCVAAIELAKSHVVTLFDYNEMLLQAASRVNQYRLHRGYHYPRSKDTAVQSNAGIQSFVDRFSTCILPSDIEHLYGISSENSLIAANEYIKFLDECDLEYTQIAIPSYIHCVDAVFRVTEDSLDIQSMRNFLADELTKFKVNVKLKTKFNKPDLCAYDVVVNATYSNTNYIVPDDQKIDYQFEVCEKPIVKISSNYGRKSIVIIDGPFGCIDPYGRSNAHVLGHVVHAIHSTSTGHFPDIPENLAKYINSSLWSMPDVSNIDKFISGLSIFFPDMMANIDHYGSMFTIRTVLPGREHDDARPSYITKHSDKLYSIFSGKIGTCVDIANELTKMI